MRPKGWVGLWLGFLFTMTKRDPISRSNFQGPLARAVCSELEAGYCRGGAECTVPAHAAFLEGAGHLHVPHPRHSFGINWVSNRRREHHRPTGDHGHASIIIAIKTYVRVTDEAKGRALAKVLAA